MITNHHIPNWRMNAPAGMSLAQAAETSLIGESPQRPTTPQATDGAALMRIVRPEAAVRWRSARVASYTPDQVETTLAGALAGDPLQQWELFDLMEDTWPRLSKNLNELKRAVTSMRWEVMPWYEEDQPTTPEAQARAKLVSHVIWRTKPDAAKDERDFPGLQYDLLDAWGKGLSLCELLWERRQTPALGNIVALRAGQWIHPRYYGFEQETGNFGLKADQVNQSQTRSGGQSILRPHSTTGGNTIPLPPNKFILGVAKARTGHMCGTAMLRPLAWWWAAANFSADWMLNYAQLFGVPIRWATYPATASDALVANIGDMLTNLGSAGWAHFPEGTMLQLIEASKTAGNSPQEAIQDRADKQCDILFLGQTLTTDAGDRGTQALGTVHERIRGGLIAGAADWLSGVLNSQLIPAILMLNYGDTDLAPEMKPEPITEKDQQAEATRYATILGAGIPVTQKQLYEDLDLQIPQPGEEVVVGRPQTPSYPGANPVDPMPFSARATVHAADATPGGMPVGDIVRQAVADAAGVRTRWLEPLAQEMQRLIAAAENDSVTDEELQRFLAEAQTNLPDLFGQMDVGALADHLENALGAAVVKGVSDTVK